MRHIFNPLADVPFQPCEVVERSLPDHLDLHREELAYYGATIISGVLNSHMVGRLRQIVEKQVRTYGIKTEACVAETLSFNPSLPEYRDLIWWPTAHAALSLLGLRDLRWFGGATIPKPAGEPRRPWHQDWWGWQDPSSRWSFPPQVGLLYYLHETKRNNGALTITPRSHRCWHGLHNVYRTDSVAAMSRGTDEIVLETFPGDMVVLDARCLHASQPMGEGPRRDLLTVWYVNDWHNHTDQVKARVQMMVGKGKESLLGPFYPHYTGDAEPLPQDYEVRL